MSSSIDRSSLLPSSIKGKIQKLKKISDLEVPNQCRYSELCSQVGEEQQIEMNLEGENIQFKKLEKKKLKAPKRKKVEHVSEYWTQDHPDRFKVEMNPILFNELKDKIRALKKSHSIKERSRVKKLSRIQERTKKMGKESEMIGTLPHFEPLTHHFSR